ncbi:MAG: hypothetical protein ACRDAS_00940 [Cetobacterium sp.]
MLDFDFNVLDEHKNSIDNGYVLEGEISPMEYIKIIKVEKNYIFTLVDLVDFEVAKVVKCENFEDFKKEIADVFLFIGDECDYE